MNDAIAVVLGGGRGARLFPLTQYRSKPAVPIGASYRLVDVAVSNCIHANLRRIFVITQYQSESLNRHIANTYKFDAFASGFIDLLVAEQTDAKESDWFGGTADAVRKTMKHLAREAWDHLVILSGDQLYRMDLEAMLRVHRESSAAATVAMKAVLAEQTQGLGIMKVDPSGRVLHFDEKPPAERLPGLESTPPGARAPVYLASMGIYAFTREAVVRALENAQRIDFGHDVLPSMLSSSRVQGYLYDGYWEDVGTVRSYFEANLALTKAGSAFNFYHPRYPIYTQRPFLAPTQFYSCHVHDALIADGCFLDRVNIDHAIIGIRSRIGADVTIKNSLVLGSDEYETAVEESPGVHRHPPLGIGDNTWIENAIIDKNARIGKNVRIQNANGVRDHDGDSYFVRDGIVIVPKSGVIPDGTVI